MSFSTFFTKQARKPSGLFGKIIMSLIFDKGNETLNRFVYELLSVQKDDEIFEIGFGTGKLIKKIAMQIDNGIIEGTDFSSTMISIARKRNKKNIENGKVRLFKANFDEMSFKKKLFNKVYSVNTLYFWKNSQNTAKKIVEILKPKGKLILAFEDVEQLRNRKLNDDLFCFYTKEEVRKLLVDAGFLGDVSIKSIQRGDSIFHCAVAIK
jgi:ubiquinone/menaquinone biosynthesis C-methylase UbiE